MLIYARVFTPCAKLHTCVYLHRAQHDIIVLFCVHILFIFEMRKVTYLCYFAPCAKVYIFCLFSKCAKLHICVISRHARNDKILQPYIHGFAQKILFMLLLKIILWYFDNYMTHCQGKNDFLLLHPFIFVVFYLKE